MRHAREKSSTEQSHAERDARGRKTRAPDHPVVAARGLTLEAMGNRALLSFLRAGHLQRKPRASGPRDPFEREADRAADAVIAGEHAALTEPLRAPAPEIQRMASEDEMLTASLGLGPERGPVAPQAASPLAEDRGAEIVGRLDGGRSLDEQTRALMEDRFGESFSEVRIHTGHRASEAADSLRSRAFTVSENIFFADGEFAPETIEGRRLLAHELAHVVQQRRPTGAIGDDRAAERDARDAAQEVARGSTPAVRERAGAGSVQKQEQEESAISTSKPKVATLTSGITSELDRVSVTVEGREIAGGSAGSLQHPRDDGGVWDAGSQILTMHVFLPRFATLQRSPLADNVARDLGMHTIVVIPVIDGDEQPPIVIAPSQVPPKPLPSKPPPQPPPEPPQPQPESRRDRTPDKPSQKGPENKFASLPSDLSQTSPEVEKREETVRKNVKSFTFNPWWNWDILNAFRDSSPAEFQQLQTALGEQGMTDVFDQLNPFFATVIGSLGPVIAGKAKLNEKRIELLLEVSRWGQNQKSFMFYWMFQTMEVEDIKSLLSDLAAQSHLWDTIETQPGMKEYLAGRGVDLGSYPETPLGFWRGAGRGLKDIGRFVVESMPAVQQAPNFRIDALPEPYRSQALESASKDFFKEMTTANMARGAASYITLGYTDFPFAIAGAGEATWQAGSDFVEGKPGEGVQKVTPVVVMIAAALLGRKLTKSPSAAVATLEGAAESKAAPVWTSAFLGVTEGGVQKFIMRHASGESFEVHINPETITGRIVHVRSGRTVVFENGAVVQNPAGSGPQPPLLLTQGKPPYITPWTYRLGQAPAVPPEPLLLGQGEPPYITPLTHQLGPAASQFPFGTAAEGAITRHYKDAVTLPRAYAAFDAVRDADYTMTFTTEKIRGKKVTVANQSFQGGEWISIKTVLKTDTASSKHITEVVAEALDDMVNKFGGKRDPVPIAPEMYWRVTAAKPDSAVLHIRVPPGAKEWVPELQKAAEKALVDKAPGDLPPIRVFVDAW